MSSRALVLAAHGSRHAAQVNERLREIARQIALPDVSSVTVAFHQGTPSFAEVLDGLVEDNVTVVPVMTSRGYYADHVLPQELARNRRFAAVHLDITAPVGTHPEITALAERRIAVLCARFGLAAAHTAIAVVGHGTPRHQRSRRATVNLASRLGYSGGFGQSFAVFLDDEPGLDAVLARATCPVVIVLPFLIGAGPHAVQDVPARIGLGAAGASLPRVTEVSGRTVVCDRPLGDDEGLVDIIADLATGGPPRQAPYHPARPLRMGTRASRLALWQTEQVAQQLRGAGHGVDTLEISTLGDRVRQCPIPDLPGDAPFCDDLESALGAGLIDLAVHSLKDVALHPPREFEIAAVLARGDAREALVARNGATLAALPGGAVVGTSSPRRAAQLLALRPDLRVEPIRGPVDDRVQQVMAGRFDAAILALAGLQRLGMAHVATEIFPLQHFVPAPAQAAMAVEVRAGDMHARAMVRGLNDNATRIATTLELNVLRELERETLVTVAAHAIVTDRVELLVKLTALDGSRSRELLHCGSNPAVVQRAALADARVWLADMAAKVKS